MSRGHGTVLRELLSLALLLGCILSARADTPTATDGIRRVSASKRVSPSRTQRKVDPLAQGQVLVRHVGFESQQQGYASKVQGAASQNILWVTPREQPSRHSWLNTWLNIFSLD